MQAADEREWREMWRGYNAFYRSNVPERATAATFRRVLDPQSPIAGFVAFADGVPIGFAHIVLHPHTWSEAPVCYLEDLYVREEARGRGAGRALIEHVIALAKREGWARVYWATQSDNATARRLYDTFCEADGFVRYTVACDGAAPANG